MSQESGFFCGRAVEKCWAHWLGGMTNSGASDEEGLEQLAGVQRHPSPLVPVSSGLGVMKMKLEQSLSGIPTRLSMRFRGN